MKLGEAITIDELIKWTKVKTISLGLKNNNKFLIETISTDSRTTKKGDFFIPIVGEKYDGHDFIVEAVKKGALGFVFQKNYVKKLNEFKNLITPQIFKKLIIFKSDSNINFLIRLSSNYIRKFNPIVVGITGSVGKTTTKDFIVGVLKDNFNTSYTPKNFNTEIGIASSIFEIDSTTQFFICELGMRASGQIKTLSQVINIDIGAITTVGPSHLEFFKSIEDIASAKAEMAEFLEKKKGILFLNNDDNWTDYIIKKVKCRVKKFGRDNNIDFNFIEKEMDVFGRYSFSFFEFNKKIIDIALPISGYHNIYNACCAAAICRYLGVSPVIIKNGIERAEIESGRMQVIEKDGKIIINDCYNASPISMEKAIDCLRQISLKNKSRSVAVLADMLELGNDSEKYHYQIGKYLSNSGVDILVAFGKFSESICKGFNIINNERLGKKGLKKVYFFNDKESLERNLSKIIKDGDTVLIKGSRANKLESLLECF